MKSYKKYVYLLFIVIPIIVIAIVFVNEYSKSCYNCYMISFNESQSSNIVINDSLHPYEEGCYQVMLTKSIIDQYNQEWSTPISSSNASTEVLKKKGSTNSKLNISTNGKFVNLKNGVVITMQFKPNSNETVQLYKVKDFECLLK